MSSQSFGYQEPETEISLTNVLWDLLGQWKAILIVAIMFALAVPGLKLFRDNRSYQTALSAAQKQQEQTNLSQSEVIENALKSLSEEDRPAVEQLVRQEQHINAEATYLDRSILMNLDPNHLRTLFLTYLVNSSEPIDYSTLAAVYNAEFQKEEFAQELGKLINPQAEPSYISELVMPDYGNMQGGTAIAVQPVENSANSDNSRHMPLVLRVVLPDDVDASAVGDFIDSYMLVANREAEIKIGQHGVLSSFRNEQYMYNDAIRTRKATIISDINNNRTIMKTSLAALSSEQKSAYDKITNSLGTQQEETKGNNYDTDSVGQPSPDTAPTAPSFNKKFAIIGFVLGIVAYTIIYLIVVILRRHLDSEDALSNCTRSRTLGGVYYPQRHSGIGILFHSNLVSKLRFGNKGDIATQLDKVATTTDSVCKHAKVSDIHVLCMGNMQAKDSSNIATDFIAQLESRGIRVHLIDVTEDSTEKELLQVQNAVYLASNDIKSSDVWGVAALCREYDVASLGCVFVRGW